LNRRANEAPVTTPSYTPTILTDQSAATFESVCESFAVEMSDQQEVKATEEKAPEKPEQQEASAEENEVADKTPEQPPKEMRAVVLTGFGGLKSVKVLKKPEPTLGEGEVLIRVKAW